MIVAVILGLVVVGVVCLKVGLAGLSVSKTESLALSKGGQKSRDLAQLLATKRVEQAIREMNDEA